MSYVIYLDLTSSNLRKHKLKQIVEPNKIVKTKKQVEVEDESTSEEIDEMDFWSAFLTIGVINPCSENKIISRLVHRT